MPVRSGQCGMWSMWTGVGSAATGIVDVPPLRPRQTPRPCRSLGVHGVWTRGWQRLGAAGAAARRALRRRHWRQAPEPRRELGQDPEHLRAAWVVGRALQVGTRPPAASPRPRTRRERARCRLVPDLEDEHPSWKHQHQQLRQQQQQQQLWQLGQRQRQGQLLSRSHLPRRLDQSNLELLCAQPRRGRSPSRRGADAGAVGTQCLPCRGQGPHTDQGRHSDRARRPRCAAPFEVVVVGRHTQRRRPALQHCQWPVSIWHEAHGLSISVSLSAIGLEARPALFSPRAPSIGAGCATLPLGSVFFLGHSRSVQTGACGVLPICTNTCMKIIELRLQLVPFEGILLARSMG
mmetsp:Transcript_14221/g.36759  ORF Transcript_14221/g.36759 Transcript_14221/m.36759 type:complete len:348 (-) Transcript_14221:352-1395(-)